MTTKFCKQVHLQEFSQMRLIKQVLVMSSLQDQVTNYRKYIYYHSPYGHQAWQIGNLVLRDSSL